MINPQTLAPGGVQGFPQASSPPGVQRLPGALGPVPRFLCAPRVHPEPRLLGKPSFFQAWVHSPSYLRTPPLLPNPSYFRNNNQAAFFPEAPRLPLRSQPPCKPPLPPASPADSASRQSQMLHRTSASPQALAYPQNAASLPLRPCPGTADHTDFRTPQPLLRAPFWAVTSPPNSGSSMGSIRSIASCLPLRRLSLAAPQTQLTRR